MKPGSENNDNDATISTSNSNKDVLQILPVATCVNSTNCTEIDICNNNKRGMPFKLPRLRKRLYFLQGYLQLWLLFLKAVFHNFMINYLF